MAEDAKDNGWPLKIIGITAVVLILTFAALIYYSQMFTTGPDGNTWKRPELILSVLLVISVIALVLSLTFTSAIFNYLGLSDTKQSLGLPEGSITAVIALSLILIFIIGSIFLSEQVSSNSASDKFTYRGITQAQLDAIPAEEIVSIERDGMTGNETLFNVVRLVERNRAGEATANQIITTLSTLAVAVSSFYFASRVTSRASAAAKARGGAPAASAPLIRSISHTPAKREEETDLKIFGKNLELAKEVKLVRDSVEIPCTGVKSTATTIECKVKIPADTNGYPSGNWTVVVINSDKGEDRLEDAFIVG